LPVLQFKQWAVSLILLSAVPFAFAQHRLVDPSAADSARPTAMRMLRHLADGNLEAAAALSNAPGRRFEVLRDYRDAVGEEEFRRIFGRYFAPENRLIAEVAIGPRRLLVWHLGEAGDHLAGQFYVEVEGRFLMDDVPSPERSELRAVLEKFRTSRRAPADRARRPRPPSRRRAPRAAGAGAGERLPALPG
jgi:hypothetical protein